MLRKFSKLFQITRNFFWAVWRNIRIHWMSWPSSGPEFRVAWLWVLPTSRWGSLGGSSSIGPWFMPYAVWSVSGAIPEWIWISGFMRKLSRRDSAPKMRFLSYWTPGTDFSLLYPVLLRKLEWYSLLVIWEHLSSEPNCSQDILHNFPCLVLLVFSDSSELPFSTGKVMISE